MSSVDERIVKMVFDNGDFTTRVASTIKSITELNKATEGAASNASGLSAMGKAFEQAEIMSTRAGFHIQDVWLKAASILEYQVAGKIVKAGKDIANALTFEGITDGLREYETQLDSVQTILANTGLEGAEGLAKVNATLDELNEYADKTIYNFTQMTRNIGTFTAAGLDLDTSAKAIQGIANLAAVSGSTSQQASTAMYQLSQALASGTVKLQDWNSVVNAGMGGKVFQNALIQTAATMSGMGDKVDEWKKKHIDAYGSFRESLTKDAWLTTDVLSQTLNQFTMAAEQDSEEWIKLKKELTDMGYTEEAANDILKMANTATEAATKVKTFTQLIDTLKEAIGSGWAQSWRILIGDFEEAKKLWTEVSYVLGGYIDRMSTARNELLMTWDSFGGRARTINSLKNVFEALVKVITPISEGMRNIFPPITAERLYKITQGFEKFTKKLIITEETATKVRKASSGFFAIFDIVGKFIGSFVRAIFPATKGITSLGSSLLDIAAKVGDFLTKVDIIITKTKLFDWVFQKLGDTIKPVIDFIMSGFSGAKDIMSSFLDGFTEKAGKAKGAGDILQAFFEGFSNAIKNLTDKLRGLKPLFEGIVSLFKGIGSVLGAVFKQIGDTFTGFASGGIDGMSIFNIINGLLSGGILYKIFSSVKNFSSLGEAFSNVMDSISGTLDAFQKRIQADNLMNLAKAIAILAGSLVIVAMVDEGKLLGATTAITALMFGMAGAMAVLMKAVNAFSTTDVESTFSLFGKKIFGKNASKMLEMSVTLGAISKALVSMGAAVLMLAVGLKVISTAAEGGHLWDSFTVITLLLTELTAVAIALGKWGGDTKEATKGLITMSASLIIMAKALEMISEVVSMGNAWESLGILGLMVAGLTGVMIAIDKLTEKKALSMAPLISMAISINLLVFALKQVSDALGSEGQHIWQALGIIGLMVAGLAAVCVVLSKFAGFSIAGGAGAILAAASLLIMVQALKQVSDALGQTDQHIWQALGVIAASLVVLAIGLTAMAGTIPGAAGLLVASAALIVLGGALKIIGSLSLAEIGKGLLAMAGSLLILAVGLTAMIVALPGALALIVAAAGLTVLAGALKLFGSMKLGEIVKSLLTLIGALASVAIITTVLSVLSPFMLAFSASLLVFGGALLATGAGMTLFSTGLMSLVSVLPMGITALKLLTTTLLDLLPVIAEKLLEALGVVATKIVELGPVFTQAAIVILDSILVAIVASTTKIAEAVLNLILNILSVLTENTPLIAQAGTDLMIAYMQAISEQIPRVVDEAYKCAIALIDGLANAIEENNRELIVAVDHLMTAVIQAIAQWLVEFTPLGFLIPEQMKEGILSGDLNVKEAIDNVIQNAVEAIKGFFDKFKEAAEYLVGGLIEGLKSSKVGQAVSAAADLGKKVIDGLNSKKGLDEHSPSVKAWESGLMLTLGLKEGIEDGTDEAVDASTLLGEKTIGGLSDTAEDGAEDIKASTSDIADSFKDMSSEVNGSTEGLGDNITDLVEKTTGGAGDVSMSLKDMLKLLGDTSEEVDNLEDVSKQAIKTGGKWNAMLEASENRIRKNNAAIDQNGVAWEKDTALTKKNTEATDENTDAKNKNTTATKNGTKAARASIDVTEYANGVIEAFTKNYGKLYEGLSDDAAVKTATYAVRRLAEETYKASLKAEEATAKNEKTKASIENMVKAFEDMKKKVYDSVKSYFEGDQFFQKFEVKTEMTMKSLLENMKSNIDGVTNWSNKLVELGTKGVDDGLLKQLAELGPKGFEYVNAFSNATAEEIQLANQYFAQAAVLPDSISNDALASYAMAGLNCVQGFVNGVDENGQLIADSAEGAGTTFLSKLKAILGIESPSKKTFEDGVYLVWGLKKGIEKFAFRAWDAGEEMCNRLNDIFDMKLAREIYVEIGKNIVLGLAEGLTNEESMGVLTEAAETVNSIIETITRKYNLIDSPSKLYRMFGNYISRGLALGIEDGVPYAEQSANTLSESVKKSIDLIQSIVDDEVDLSPVISPVLDLSGVRNKAGQIRGLFPGQSIAMASSVGIGKNTNYNDASTSQPIAGTQVNFTQNNYSPKALSRVEIYRQTKNQISMMKGVKANA